MNDQPLHLEDLITNPSFIRWATGRANPQEARRWDEWAQASEHNRLLALQAQQRIAGVSFEEHPHLHKHREHDWQRIEQQILSTRKKEPDFRHLRPRKKDSLTITLRIAAIVLIAALCGLAILYMQQTQAPGTDPSVAVHTITTAFSEKKTIGLSDGSQIILAAGSRLSYNDDWLQKPTKQVTLLKGEAFFSIQPGENRDRTHPAFEVITEDGTTAVLGTQFTVSTYGEGTRVVLQEGEVEMTVAETGDELHSSVTLAPGEMAQMKKHHPDIALQYVNPRVYTSWISDHLFFDETSLSVLADRIERTYGVDVQVDNPELLELKLSGAVDFRSLDALINAVSEVLDIRIHRVDERVIITN